LEKTRKLPVPILVDCNTNQDMHQVYLDAFSNGIHVITANKKTLSGSYNIYKQMKAKAQEYHRLFDYEPTVGTSLPIIDTLHSLERTGDKVQMFECSLSGTLGFITTKVTQGCKLSEAVQEAEKLGYCELHPQEDLSGLDVARKSLILAREVGLQISLEDIHVEPLVPASITSIQSITGLYEALKAYDSEFEQMIQRLKSEGKALRYLTLIKPGRNAPKITVGPREVTDAEPAAHLKGSEVMFAFTTKTYDQHPLIVQGARAGHTVVANIILSNILKSSHKLRGEF